MLGIAPYLADSGLAPTDRRRPSASLRDAVHAVLIDCAGLPAATRFEADVCIIGAGLRGWLSPAPRWPRAARRRARSRGPPAAAPGMAGPGVADYEGDIEGAASRAAALRRSGERWGRPACRGTGAASACCLCRAAMSISVTGPRQRLADHVGEIERQYRERTGSSSWPVGLRRGVMGGTAPILGGRSSRPASHQHGALRSAEVFTEREWKRLVSSRDTTVYLNAPSERSRASRTASPTSRSTSARGAGRRCPRRCSCCRWEGSRTAPSPRRAQRSGFRRAGSSSVHMDHLRCIGGHLWVDDPDLIARSRLYDIRRVASAPP